MKRLICRHCGDEIFQEDHRWYNHTTGFKFDGCHSHWWYTKGINREDLRGLYASPLTDNDLIDKLLEKYKSTVGLEPIESKNLGEFRV